MNQNLNINQFALPGMEKLAHPGAPYLAKGISFTHQEEKGSYDFGDMAPGAKQPIHYHSHYLYAHKMGDRFNPAAHHGNALGFIQWAGAEATHEQGTHYPGEIEYVERNPSTPERHRGMMSALYNMGHQMSFGQTTVPTHSPTRTPEGEAWSEKVGGPRPERGDYKWKPPAGIHPYEQQARDSVDEHIARKNKMHPLGQQHFPGMGKVDDIMGMLGY